MKRIGLLSDTHSCWDERFAEYFADCDEIWHAGDVGSMEVADKLAALHPLRCVCGNCDGGDLRIVYPPLARFRVEEVEVMMTHIGGYPGHYAPHIRERLMSRPTDLFVCGHSHILKVVRDPSLGLCTSTLARQGIRVGTWCAPSCVSALRASVFTTSKSWN